MRAEICGGGGARCKFCRDASNIFPLAATHPFSSFFSEINACNNSIQQNIPFVREFQSVSLMASFRYISVQQSASFFSSMQKETNDVIPPSFLLSFWLVCAFQSWALRKKRRNWELARHSVPPFSREKYTDGRGQNSCSESRRLIGGGGRSFPPYFSCMALDSS